MRSAEEQEEFLEHARFGEGAHVNTRSKIHRLVWAGLALLLVGGAILGTAVVFDIGRDDGGPFFVMGFIAAGAVGVVLCFWGLVDMWIHRC